MVNLLNCLLLFSRNCLYSRNIPINSQRHLIPTPGFEGQVHHYQWYTGTCSGICHAWMPVSEKQTNCSQREQRWVAEPQRTLCVSIQLFYHNPCEVKEAVSVRWYCWVLGLISKIHFCIPLPTHCNHCIKYKSLQHTFWELYSGLSTSPYLAACQLLKALCFHCDHKTSTQRTNFAVVLCLSSRAQPNASLIQWEDTHCQLSVLS